MQVLELFYGRYLVFPTVESAQDYRSELLKQRSHGGRVNFPNIITMTGEKVESAGALFGDRNTMPAEGRRRYPVRVAMGSMGLEWCAWGSMPRLCLVSLVMKRCCNLRRSAALDRGRWIT
jgi:hypothetical protein